MCIILIQFLVLEKCASFASHPRLEVGYQLILTMEHQMANENLMREAPSFEERKCFLPHRSWRRVWLEVVLGKLLFINLVLDELQGAIDTTPVISIDLHTGTNLILFPKHKHNFVIERLIG